MVKRLSLASVVVALSMVIMLPDHGLSQAADKITLQLKWVTQAQFAGYYAAKAKGMYAAEKLDVTIRPGGPDIVPEQVVAGGGAQFGIDWLPSLLSARDQGVPLVNIGQVIAHSGMTADLVTLAVDRAYRVRIVGRDPGRDEERPVDLSRAEDLEDAWHRLEHAEAALGQRDRLADATRHPECLGVEVERECAACLRVARPDRLNGTGDGIRHKQPHLSV